MCAAPVPLPLTNTKPSWCALPSVSCQTPPGLTVPSFLSPSRRPLPHDWPPLLELSELLAQLCQIPQHPQPCPSLGGCRDPLYGCWIARGSQGVNSSPCSLLLYPPPTWRRQGDPKTSPPSFSGFLGPGHCFSQEDPLHPARGSWKPVGKLKPFQSVSLRDWIQKDS